MGDKQKFQEVLEDIRKDITYLKVDLFNELVRRATEKLRDGVYYTQGFNLDSETRDWILDVFLDKCYETDIKIRKIITDLGYTGKLPLTEIRNKSEALSFGTFLYNYSVGLALDEVSDSIDHYRNSVESTMSSIRKELHEKNWTQVKKLKTVDYVLPTQRAKYVSAREELAKAKQAVKEKQWEEVLNHLRPAIDLALKEKYGFMKISPMRQFLDAADKYNLPLPSYTMLYDYFDEGSQRIHGGRLNTPFECQKALEFVAGFIDQLDLIDVPKAKIEEFKRKCKAVA